MNYRESLAALTGRQIRKKNKQGKENFEENCLKINRVENLQILKIDVDHKKW